MFAGIATHQPGPTDHAARSEALNGLQAGAIGFWPQAAQLALEDQQDSIGQDIGAQDRLPELKATWLQQGLQGLGRCLVE